MTTELRSATKVRERAAYRVKRQTISAERARPYPQPRAEPSAHSSVLTPMVEQFITVLQQQLQQVRPMAPPTTETPYSKERVELENALASLLAQDSGATRAQHQAATDTWQRILAVEPHPYLPALGLKDDGVLYLSWNYSHARSSVHIDPEGRIEWYFKDVQTGARMGSGAEPVGQMPPVFFTLMRGLRRP